MFEEQKSKISQLDETELDLVLKVLSGQNTWPQLYDDFFYADPPNPQMKPPRWLLQWTESLRFTPIYNVVLEPVFSTFGVIWDKTTGESWYCSMGPDSTCLLHKRTPKPFPQLSAEDVWPDLHEKFKGIGVSVIYGDFTIEYPKLVSKDRIAAYLRELAGGETLPNEEGTTVEEWLQANFGRANRE